VRHGDLTENLALQYHERLTELKLRLLSPLRPSKRVLKRDQARATEVTTPEASRGRGPTVAVEW